MYHYKALLRSSRSILHVSEWPKFAWSGTQFPCSPDTLYGVIKIFLDWKTNNTLSNHIRLEYCQPNCSIITQDSPRFSRSWSKGHIVLNINTRIVCWVVCGGVLRVLIARPVSQAIAVGPERSVTQRSAALRARFDRKSARNRNFVKHASGDLTLRTPAAV